MNGPGFSPHTASSNSAETSGQGPSHDLPSAAEIARGPEYFSAAMEMLRLREQLRERHSDLIEPTELRVPRDLNDVLELARQVEATAAVSDILPRAQDLYDSASACLHRLAFESFRCLWGELALKDEYREKLANTLAVLKQGREEIYRRLAPPLMTGVAPDLELDSLSLQQRRQLLDAIISFNNRIFERAHAEGQNGYETLNQASHRADPSDILPPELLQALGPPSQADATVKFVNLLCTLIEPEGLRDIQDQIVARLEDRKLIAEAGRNYQGLFQLVERWQIGGLDRRDIFMLGDLFRLAAHLTSTDINLQRCLMRPLMVNDRNILHHLDLFLGSKAVLERYSHDLLTPIISEVCGRLLRWAEGTAARDLCFLPLSAIGDSAVLHELLKGIDRALSPDDIPTFHALSRSELFVSALLLYRHYPEVMLEAIRAYTPVRAFFDDEKVAASVDALMLVELTNVCVDPQGQLERFGAHTLQNRWAPGLRPPEGLLARDPVQWALRASFSLGQTFPRSRGLDAARAAMLERVIGEHGEIPEPLSNALYSILDRSIVRHLDVPGLAPLSALAIEHQRVGLSVEGIHSFHQRLNELLSRPATEQGVPWYQVASNVHFLVIMTRFPGYFEEACAALEFIHSKFPLTFEAKTGAGPEILDALLHLIDLAAVQGKTLESARFSSPDYANGTAVSWHSIFGLDPDSPRQNPLGNVVTTSVKVHGWWNSVRAALLMSGASVAESHEAVRRLQGSSAVPSYLTGAGELLSKWSCLRPGNTRYPSSSDICEALEVLLPSGAPERGRDMFRRFSNTIASAGPDWIARVSLPIAARLFSAYHSLQEDTIGEDAPAFQHFMQAATSVELSSIDEQRLLRIVDSPRALIMERQGAERVLARSPGCIELRDPLDVMALALALGIEANPRNDASEKSHYFSSPVTELWGSIIGRVKDRMIADRAGVVPSEEWKSRSLFGRSQYQRPLSAYRPVAPSAESELLNLVTEFSSQTERGLIAPLPEGWHPSEVHVLARIKPPSEADLSAEVNEILQRRRAELQDIQLARATVSVAGEISAAQMKRLDLPHIPLFAEMINRIPYGRDIDRLLSTKNPRDFLLGFVELAFDGLHGGLNDELKSLRMIPVPLMVRSMELKTLYSAVAKEYLRHEGSELKGSRMPIQFLPTRGILTRFAGEICRTCLSRDRDLALQYPHLTFVSFVKNPDGQNARASTAPSLAGGALVLETQSSDGEKLFLVRGFNPRTSLLRNIRVAELTELLLDYLTPIARSRGAQAIVVPREDSWGLALSNRPLVVLDFKARYYATGRTVALASEPTPVINNIPVERAVVVREIAQ